MGNRSNWKGPFVDPSVLKKIQNNVKKNNNNKIIKTWSRNSTILPNFIGLRFLIYNGKKFITVTIKNKMIGKKLGEFSPTRNFKGHNNGK